MIADEATRSLDGTVQAEILNLLREVNKEVGSALLFITHDPKLLAGFADRVIVMYGGRIVGEVDPGKTKKEEIGLMMTGAAHVV